MVSSAATSSTGSYGSVITKAIEYLVAQQALRVQAEEGNAEAGVARRREQGGIPITER